MWYSCPFRSAQAQIVERVIDLQRRGFTLIELLVVIAIIAILAAILFPVFAKAREKARQSSCLSNVKQLALAALQYTQDYDEFLPASYKVGPPALWPDTIQPYVKNQQVFVCPSLSGPLATQWNSTQHMAYGWNYNYLTSAVPGRAAGYNLPTASLGQVQSPAETIMLGDGPACADMPAGRLWYPDIYTGSRVNAMGYVIAYSGAYFPNLRHNDMANIAFVDGHAKACNMGYLSQSSVWDCN